MKLSERLALDRTMLANERTFLAYARTSMVFVVSSVTLLKLFEGNRIANIVGLALIPCAIAVGLIGLVRCYRLSRSMSSLQRPSSSRSAPRMDQHKPTVTPEP